MVIVEAHGLAAGQAKGFMASVHRHLAASMQVPGVRRDPSQYYVAPYLENIPLSLFESALDLKYWSRKEEGVAVGAIPGLTPGVVTFDTLSSKAVAALWQLESCRGFASGAGKLVLPSNVVEATRMLIAQPPGQIIHRVRADGSMVVEAHFNFATFNEVSTPTATPALPLPLPPPSHSKVPPLVFSTAHFSAAHHTHGRAAER